MIWQEGGCAAQERCDWLTADKAVYERLGNIITRMGTTPNTKKKKVLGFSSSFCVQVHFRVVMFVR